MDKTELGLMLCTRISSGKCFVCGEDLSKTKREVSTYEHSKFGLVKAHSYHDKTLFPTIQN